MLNTFTNKAVVWFDDVWQIAFGEQKRENNDFIFFHNGRIECVHDGSWFSLRFDCTDDQSLDQAIRCNIQEIGRNPKCTEKS